MHDVIYAKHFIKLSRSPHHPPQKFGKLLNVKDTEIEYLTMLENKGCIKIWQNQSFLKFAVCAVSSFSICVLASFWPVSSPPYIWHWQIKNKSMH